MLPQIIDILKERYPDPKCALHYAKDYELMIAVRLSAQCTDARVNLVTPPYLPSIRHWTPLQRQTLRMWKSWYIPAVFINTRHGILSLLVKCFGTPMTDGCPIPWKRS